MVTNFTTVRPAEMTLEGEKIVSITQTIEDFEAERQAFLIAGLKEAHQIILNDGGHYVLANLIEDRIRELETASK